MAVSPVGCSVFLYYYFDVGNTQAAHGRAPAVALGHKLANPESIVISYQGDGDLASIGLAEIVSVAQLGHPHHRHLRQQRDLRHDRRPDGAHHAHGPEDDARAPTAATRFTGEPLKVAEMIAGLDGPVYVERVALFDAKNRVKAEKAIKKALRLQVEGKGFSFVEVLAECPTHLKMTPVESEKWVKEQMLPVFPLGVKKDVAREEAVAAAAARRTSCPAKMLDVIGGIEPGGRAVLRRASRARRGATTSASSWPGAGGDGAQTAALLIARAAINEGFDATHIPSYGPESRGGTSYADVRIAEDEVLSPAAPDPHILVAFNAPSLAKFAPHVPEGGVDRLRQLGGRRELPAAAAGGEGGRRAVHRRSRPTSARSS